MALEFPKLMQIRGDLGVAGFVILVDRLLNGATGFGTVVKASDGAPYGIGACSDSWDLAQFEDFEGVVILSQGGR